MEKKITYAGLSKVLFFMVLVGAIYSSIKSVTDEDFQSNKFREEYPLLLIDNEINNKLIDSVFVHMGFVFVDLPERRKYCIPHSRNYEYRPYFLGEFLMPGDTITKKNNSDTVVIKRNDKKYFFIVGKSLNEELR
ncbi:hypothetical protein [Reichenbachiella sp.]|uniref:hypothetical protein n=1 Tax=Reichenbachiella sp. TaxID=2184521 RepID=UPI003297A43C